MVAPTNAKNRLARVFEEEQATVLAEVIHDAYSDLVHTGDFNELKEIVRDLAVSQQRTEMRVEELATAQQRTEMRVEELATAQQRTEQRVGELATAQQRTEMRLGELATAQQRTEVSIKNLSRQVGGLSDRFGGDLEDTAYIVLYDVLQRDLGWQVDPLERSWEQWNGEEEEIDIFGQAHDPARPDTPIWIVGEVKHNLTMKEVERFAKQVQRAREHLVGEIFAVCFCYRARPEVRQAVKDAGLRMVYSYGRLV